jgi:hypothetical protein
MSQEYQAYCLKDVCYILKKHGPNHRIVTIDKSECILSSLYNDFFIKHDFPDTKT